MKRKSVMRTGRYLRWVTDLMTSRNRREFHLCYGEVDLLGIHITGGLQKEAMLASGRR